MTLIPAICDSCGTLWGDQGLIDAEGAKGLTFTRVKVGPCPKCGGMGSIPDGVYDVEDDVLQVVRSDMPPESLQGLIDLLESLRRGNATEAEVFEKVEAEAPDLVPVIRQFLEKADLKFWVPILISLLLWQFPSPGSSPPTAEEIANDLRADNVPGLTARKNQSAQPAKAKRKPPKKARGKGHGEAKQRKSRKRR